VNAAGGACGQPAWPLYQGYRYYLVTGDLAAGTPLPPWIWFLPVIYLGIPIAVGAVVGKGSRKQARWVRPITGLANAPRGWDQLFRTPKLKGYMRVRLIDDTTPPTWIVGVFGKSPDNSKLPDSYAAGFPHEQDLVFLEHGRRRPGRRGHYKQPRHSHPYRCGGSRPMGPSRVR